MILLDTCTFIWLVFGSPDLSSQARGFIQKSNGLFLSAISIFEIAIKAKKGKLKLPSEIREWYMAAIDNHNITEIPLISSIAITATLIDLPHADPFDRIIAATAKENRLILLTPDAQLTQCKDIRCEW